MVFQWWVWGCASHSWCTLLSAPTLFCRASRLIRGSTYFSGLFLNNFPFRYKVIAATNCKNLKCTFLYRFVPLKTCASNARLTWSAGCIFIPHLSIFAPMNHGKSRPTDILTDLLDVYSYKKVLSWVFIDILMKECKIVTCLLIYIYLPILGTK